MKIIVHPDYQPLLSTLGDIVNGKYSVEHVYCNRRNTVERVVLPDGRKVVVKRYKMPNSINRWVYGVLRKSKARRAYEFGLLLIEKGVDTPKPIAYMEQRLHGAMTWSWSVSEYVDATPFSELYASLRQLAAEGDTQAEQQIQKLRQSLTQYVVQLEEKNVVPGDFNHANILVTEVEDDYHFSLVDINRMHIDKQATLHSTMKMYSQFCRSYQDALDFLPLYAEARNIDYDKCMYIFACQRNHLLKRKQRKLVAHRMFGE